MSLSQPEAATAAASGAGSSADAQRPCELLARLGSGDRAANLSGRSSKHGSVGNYSGGPASPPAANGRVWAWYFPQKACRVCANIPTDSPGGRKTPQNTIVTESPRWTSACSGVYVPGGIRHGQHV